MYADTHCHLDFAVFRDRLPEILGEMSARDLGFVVIPAVALSSFAGIEKLCQQDERLFMGLGLHPYFIEQHADEDLAGLESALSHFLDKQECRLVAVGEIGLDGSCPDLDKQVRLFRAQLALAEKYRLPVIVHARKCNEQMFRCLREVQLVGGVIHAFSGSYELLMRYVRLGFKIGVGPVITWPSAHKTRDAIARAPLDALVLETDAPGMRVADMAEDEVGPCDVLRVFQVLLNLRTETEELIQNSLWLESQRLFGLNIG